MIELPDTGGNAATWAAQTVAALGGVWGILFVTSLGFRLIYGLLRWMFGMGR